MSNSTAMLGLLAVFIAAYTGVMWVIRITVKRGDEIQTGVVRGLRVSAKYRRLMLITQWFPYTAFIIVFLFTTAAGTFHFARQYGDRGVEIVGYMCALVLGGGGVFIIVLASFLLAHFLSTLREESRS
jgi:hypothetical protein